MNLKQNGRLDFLLPLFFVIMFGGVVLGADKIALPESFPQSDYTPFGYIDNPWHSAVHNRSGAIRSLPPMGYGFWCRRLAFPYGDALERQVGYLSFLHLSVKLDGVTLLEPEDFNREGINLVSRYHTKNMMSYDWEQEGLQFSAKFFLANENALCCIVDVVNNSAKERSVILNATNIYGWNSSWWGSDGFTAHYDKEHDAALSTMWAYGDFFALGADGRSAARKFTVSEQQWTDWIRRGDLSSNTSTTTDGTERKKGPVYSMLSYPLTVAHGEHQQLFLCLARGTNPDAVFKNYQKALSDGREILKQQLASDERFYRDTPLLTGDWPSHWKHGWIYDWETLRMTVRPAVGIYKHPWDGMQPWTPRQVLGETMLDMMCMSYADTGLAKEVILGTFMDSPAANIPCSREDGSVNMTSAGGHVCGTAPIWGYPFLTIRSIYQRDGDKQWVQNLYPYLKTFVEWWLANRTDAQGWFHTACSWESGQDGSKRFKVAGDNPGAVADMVRTCDIEAAMAHAMSVMADFSKVAGRPLDEQRRWEEMAKEGQKRARSMFVDEWYRDFDSRNTHSS